MQICWNLLRTSSFIELSIIVLLPVLFIHPLSRQYESNQNIGIARYLLFENNLQLQQRAEGAAREDTVRPPLYCV